MKRNLSKVRMVVGERAGWKCRYCSKPLPVGGGTVDHITPKANGGTDDLKNLALSCLRCNRKKADGNPIYRKKRVKNPPDLPATVAFWERVKAKMEESK